ncbi:MAG: AAC(3) family N-acetyltransferase [Planctomycetes bacterium]|nr:AAC(3) family N-acetyltransferase [Planctomycetota bacterium]
MWTKSQLTEAFRNAGLHDGDLVLVHSALRKLAPVDGGADTVIDALLEAVGPDGTVAVPTHTWGVVGAGQPVFHQALTPSNVGALTNVFRKRPGAIRGLHPTHSVAAIGPRAAEFVGGHEQDDTPCSANSPYRRLCDWGGKVLIIGAGLDCCTLFHGCEQWAGMPWAVTEHTVQLYSIAADGRVIPACHHQHFTNTWDQYPRLEPHLIEAGAMRITHIGECALRLLDARAAADWLIAQLRKDPSIILPEKMPPTAAPS